MIGLKKFIRSKVIPYTLVLIAVLVIIYIWRSFSDSTKTEQYGSKTFFDYKHRWYQAGDRFSFDRMVPGDSIPFRKSVPFYFAAEGFVPHNHILDDQAKAIILKNAKVRTPHPELQIRDQKFSIEESKMRNRSKTTAGVFLEFVEDLADLDRGTLQFFSKKVKSYSLLVNYTLSLDTFTEAKPLLLYVELPGLAEYTGNVGLKPVLLTAFRDFEAYDGEKVFLAHKNVYHSKAGLRFWAIFKYIFFVFIVVVLVGLKIWLDSEETEEEDGLAGKIVWTDEKWTAHYEVVIDQAFEKGDFKKALEKAKEAIKDQVHSEQIYVHAISSALNMANFEKAVSMCTDAEKLYPESVVILCLHGQAIQALKQDGEKALQYFEKAKKLDTEGYGSDTINIGLASCNAQLGKIEEAVENISLLSEEAYETPEVYNIAAFIYAKANMPDRVLETTTKWLKVAPHNKEAQTLHQQAVEAISKAGEKKEPEVKVDMNKFMKQFDEVSAELDLEKTVEQARQLFGNGRQDEALKLLNSLEDGKTQNAKTIYTMAWLYFNLGAKQQSESLFSRTIELSNREIPVLKDTLTTQPGNIDNLIRLANLYSYIAYALYNTNRKSASVNAYVNQKDALAQIIGIDPKRQDILRALASVLATITSICRELGDNGKVMSYSKEEIQTLRKLLDLSPDAPLQAEIAIKVNNLGKLYDAEGNHESAFECYELAIDINSTILANESGRSDWARTLSVFYNNFGSLLNKTGEKHKALEAFKSQNRIMEELVAKEPHRKDFLNDLANSLGWLGSVYSALGETQLASAAYEKQKEALEKSKA